MSPLLRPRYADGDCLDLAGWPLRLAVNPRARRLAVRIDRVRREAVATAPSARRLADAVAFARSRADWISERLETLPRTQPLAPGQTVTLFGVPVRLEAGAPAAEDGRLSVLGEGEAWRRAMLRKLKQVALDGLTERTADACATLGEPLPKIGMGDPKARWGSCRHASQGRPALIRYSWRLVFAPDSVAAYVCAHEAAHLQEGNHGPRFWAIVDRLYGDHRPARAWLRAHGAELHALG